MPAVTDISWLSPVYEVCPTSLREPSVLIHTVEVTPLSLAKAQAVLNKTVPLRPRSSYRPQTIP